MRTALLVNPKSRRGASAEAAVLAALRAGGVSVTVEHTRCAGDGVRAAHELSTTHDRLFVLGGDGTVMEAITGLAAAGSDLPVGIVPAGTGNQLARALGISLTPARAAAQLLAGRALRVDVGILNGHRRLGIGAGLGLDAAMIAGAHGQLKQRLGVASYLVAAASVALHPRRFAVRAEVDGRVIEREAAVAMVLNLGRIFNGLLEVAPGASLLDGQLDLVMVDARTLVDALSFSVQEMLLRRRYGDPRWTFARGEHVSIETVEAGVPAQVDGDLIETARLDVVVAPGAGHLLVPAGAAVI
ncbi:MAG: diacylglycerol kinase family protein [Gemmatimonadota bacterium]|nr:diacylglycerol kinase family protein [Gemmatimonadota bacterium]